MTELTSSATQTSDNNAVHTAPPIARFANEERFSGGPVTADVIPGQLQNSQSDQSTTMGTLPEFNLPQKEILRVEIDIRRSALGLLMVSSVGAIFGGFALFEELVLPPEGVIKYLIESNKAGVEVYQVIIVRIVWAYTLLVASCFVLLGSLQMVNRSSFRRARAASVVAMLPLVGPCFVLGIPFGLWAYSVLSKPGVRQLFHNVPLHQKQTLQING